MKLNHLSAYETEASIALLVRRSLHVVRRLRGLPGFGVEAIVERMSLPLVGLLSPSGYFQIPTLPNKSVITLLGFFPLQRSCFESPITRVSHTRLFPPSGFLTLLTAYFFQSPPALLHAGNTHGVFRKDFSPTQSIQTLSRLIFLLMLTLDKNDPKPPDQCLIFRTLLPARIRHLQSGCDPTKKAAALLVFAL
jgi:hypothetical protein